MELKNTFLKSGYNQDSQAQSKLWGNQLQPTTPPSQSFLTCDTSRVKLVQFRENCIKVIVFFYRLPEFIQRDVVVRCKEFQFFNMRHYWMKPFLFRKNLIDSWIIHRRLKTNLSYTVISTLQSGIIFNHSFRRYWKIIESASVQNHHSENLIWSDGVIEILWSLMHWICNGYG